MACRRGDASDTSSDCDMMSETEVKDLKHNALQSVQVGGLCSIDAIVPLPICNLSTLS